MAKKPKLLKYYLLLDDEVGRRLVVRTSEPLLIGEVVCNGNGIYTAEAISPDSISEEILKEMAQWYFFRYISPKTKLSS